MQIQYKSKARNAVNSGVKLAYVQEKIRRRNIRAILPLSTLLYACKKILRKYDYNEPDKIFPCSYTQHLREIGRTSL
jgi:hypothetical protein